MKFLTYHIEASILLMIFVIVYKIIFSKEKYFILNRLYLLFAVIFSFIAPLLNFKQIEIVSQNSVFQPFEINEIIVNSNINLSITVFSDILFFIYTTVALVLLIIFISKLLKITFTISKNSFNNVENFKIAEDNQSDTSFTFLNFIVIGSKMLSIDEIKMIREHEKIHVLNYHTIDLLLFEFLKIFQWFNPAVYLMYYEMKNNHEFLADSKVGKSNLVQEYKNLLAKSIKGAPLYPINSFFNKSIIRKRFEMLSKKKNKTAILKYLAVVPLASILFLFVACNQTEEPAIEAAVQLNKSENVTKNEATNSESSSPETKNQQYSQEIISAIQNNLKYPEKAQRAGVESRVLLSITLENSGIISDVKVAETRIIKDGKESVAKDEFGFEQEAIRVIEGINKLTPAKDENGKNVKVQFNLPIRFRLN